MFVLMFWTPGSHNMNAMNSKSIHWVIGFILIGLLSATLFSCSDDDPEPGFATVTDVDGNAYHVVTIGFSEWTVENLRVRRYNNGDPIPTGLRDDEWENTTEGAYAIYPHEGGPAQEDVEGINSDEDMVSAYGKLYNWFAVEDARGLCPEGWSVPTDDDWTQLVDYLMEKYGLHNNWGLSGIDGVGNALKSCRQVNSPLGGSCNTIRHPRWSMHYSHYGMNMVGLSLLPGGTRIPSGYFFLLGKFGYWWSADEHSTNYAWSREASKDTGNISRYFPDKSSGLSVRCIRAIDN